MGKIELRGEFVRRIALVNNFLGVNFFVVPCGRFDNNLVVFVRENLSHGRLLILRDFRLKFKFYGLLHLKLLFAFFIKVLNINRGLVNFDDTDKPYKLDDSNRSDGGSGGFGLCCHLTESIAVSITGGVDNIGENRDIKEQRSRTDDVQPKEETQTIIVEHKTAEDDFNPKNGNQSDIDQVKSVICGLGKPHCSDIITHEGVNGQESDGDLEGNAALIGTYLIRTFFTRWLMLTDKSTLVTFSCMVSLTIPSLLFGFYTKHLFTSYR